MAESMYTMKIGKYRGCDIEDLPTDYLTWLMEQNWFEEKFPDAIDPINKELKFREKF